jgi:hypothetical protein
MSTWAQRPREVVEIQTLRMMAVGFRIDLDVKGNAGGLIAVSGRSGASRSGVSW